MTTIAILAILAILGVATLSLAGFTVVSPVAAQIPTGDNTSMTGNMTGLISSFDESESGGGTGGGEESGGGGG